jgi:hypothetical protein
VQIKLVQHRIPWTSGELYAVSDNKGYGYRSERLRWNGSMSSAEERPDRSVGGSVAGTKKEEKQNFRVRFLHTAARK